MRRISLLNTSVDSISIDDTVKELFQNIENKKKSLVLFINALKVYEVYKNKELKNTLEKADYLLADGVPIVWVSKLFGTPIPGRVNGTDLFELLLKEADHNNKRVFFLGAKEEVLELMVFNLKQKHPLLQIAGYRNGYFKDSDDEEIINLINNANADILFLGFSSPKKELWATKYKEKLNVGVIQGVGGSFDVLAGVVSRAPIWMQKSALEWLYRILKEPRRMLRRYLITNLYFIYLTAKYFIIKRDK
jgi:N-acetylglucosaminyldiphosphoundecaprenol N-acetyl-beta-D-mannosaminyltransferase